MTRSLAPIETFQHQICLVRPFLRRKPISYFLWGPVGTLTGGGPAHKAQVRLMRPELTIYRTAARRVCAKSVVYSAPPARFG